MTKFKVGQEIECVLGYNKGKRFIIVKILKGGMYSMKSTDKNDEKYYGYSDEWLKDV